MTARQGAHRRTTTTVAATLGQLRQTRAQLADTADELAAVTAERDELAGVVAELRGLVVELAGGGDHTWCAAERARVIDAAESRGIERGRMLEAAENAHDWNEAARPIARGGPAYSELENRRWGEGGPAAFGAPRPGDYAGGPVEWPADVEDQDQAVPA